MASTDKYFIIAIGGTGMRCLESFTHMSAMGLFDSKEIDILTLDTDQTNGNKQRVEELIALYNRIKTTPGKNGGAPNSDTFFSAKLNLYRFWTDYNSPSRTRFKNITKLNSADPDNKLLADLFLEDNVQDYNLAHGYRAQTHLGSYLMYHAIVEAARNLQTGKEKKSEEEEFEVFFNKIFKAGADAKVFIFGSIFGGTGASSIPVLPKALNDAIKIRDKNMSLHKDAKFGATLLTEYFSFKKPDASQRANKDDSVIADSSFFTLNSQAALQFYQGDPTVQRTYKRMYHIGWPIESEDFSKDKNDKITVTGGGDQKNPCHITEFLSACAAFDFFNRDKGIDVDKAEYLYKSVRYKNGVLDFNFNDFIGEGDNGKLFARKFGAFVSFMHLAQTINKGAQGHNGVHGFLNRLESQSISDYKSIEEQYTQDLNKYLQYFGYTVENNKFIPGWLYQLKSTVSGKFVLDDKAFTRNLKELDKFDAGKIFSEKDYHWNTTLFGNSYDPFIKTLLDKDTRPKNEEQKVSETNEKFLAHVYNAIKKSQKI
jgi:hypothetical protein